MKRSRESKRARVARRACVKRRRAAAARKPVVPVKPVAPPAVAVPVAPVVVSPAPAQPAPVAPAPVASALGVDAFDIGGLFTLRLTRVAIPVGTVTIYYRNRDVSEHNLWIEGPGADAPLLVSDSVGENVTATKRIDVGTGAWRLFCSLAGHESMSETVTVG